MQVTFSFRTMLKGFARLWPIAGILLIFPGQVRPDFWALAKDKGQPETVKLVRKLPPVAARSGTNVRFEAEIAGSSIPPETATILREKIRTLLLNTKAGSIQLVEGPADTVIKCIVTGYEPKAVHPAERQVGMQHQQIVTWIGNMQASVQVIDGRGKPIDAANLKEHLENDFIVAQREENITAVTEKKASWRDKLAGGLNVVKGGDKGDIASLAGGGKKMHDALGADGKGGRPPTDLEWRDALIEGLAAKVANRIVPVDQEFVAILPVDKEFGQIRELAKSGRWGDVQEQTEKMSSLQGNKEAFRLYTLGLSYEALGYRDGIIPDQAAESLNKSSKYYDDARKIDPGERELLLAQIRVQDSLDHYLEIQHYLKNRPVTTGPSPAPKQSAPTQKASVAATNASNDNVPDNAALIEMAQANMSEPIMITFVRTAADPKFDVSAGGLLQLGRAKVPANVIEAVQKRMAPSQSAGQSSPRRTPSVKPVPAPRTQQ